MIPSTADVPAPVRINAIAGAIQVVVVTAVLFTIYGLLRIELGTKVVGAWSIVQSVIVLVNGGMAAFCSAIAVAIGKCDSPTNRTAAAGCVRAALTIVLVALAPILMGLDAAGRHFEAAVASASLEGMDGPWRWGVLAFVTLTALSAVYLATLDGLRISNLRSVIVVKGTLLGGLLAVVLVPRFHLTGLVFAQCAQAASILLLASNATRRRLAGQSLFRPSTERPQIRSLLDVGIYLPWNSMMVSVADLGVKSILARNGGLEYVAAFEVANRSFLQLQVLLGSGLQAILPLAARKAAGDGDQLNDLYLRSQRLALVIALGMTASVCFLAPVLAVLLLGEARPFFLWTVSILSVGWALNYISMPAYYVNVATGAAGRNTLAILAIVLATWILVPLAHGWMGPIGAVMAFAGALGGASVTIAVDNSYRLGLSMKEIHPSMLAVPVVSGLTSVILGLWVLGFLVMNPWVLHVPMVLAALAVTLAIPIIGLPVARAELIALMFPRVASR